MIALFSTTRRGLYISLRRFSAVWLFAIFVVAFSAARPEVYPTAVTFRLTVSGQVPTGLLAFAVLVPLAAGAFDLSVGAMLAFSMVILTIIEQHTHMNAVPASLIAIVSCAVVGAVNGLVVVKLRVNSFIATLGMSEVLLAATLYISDNRQISGVFSSGFLAFTQKRFLGLTLDIYYLVAVALILWFFLEHTPVGRYVYATGGNPEAARLAGVPTDRVIWGTLVASGTISGLAGVIFASQVGLFSTTFGAPLLFPAFAAVFFGSTQIKNRPNVWGAVIAMLALAFGVQGFQLVFYGSAFWITPLFNGIALVLAVSAASYQRVVRRRKARPSGDGAAPAARAATEPDDESRPADVDAPPAVQRT